MELFYFVDEVFDSEYVPCNGSTSSELEARVCIQQRNCLGQFARKLCDVYAWEMIGKDLGLHKGNDCEGLDEIIICPVWGCDRLVSKAKVIDNQVMAAPVPVALEVGVDVVASHAGALELDTYSSSEADPSKSSLPPVSVAPMVSPFLCSDDSYRVTSRSSSPTTSTLEIPTAPILPAPSAIVAPSTDIISPVDASPGIH
ncbi:hypothetical protein Tco_0894481 [Tanacetum coccineum]|uniref:Uncharacterized protein n=1 Tax=Tanacetum coccineum TaxID=301880 RepID=A0ABQ5CD57_9ASTR